MHLVPNASAVSPELAGGSSTRLVRVRHLVWHRDEYRLYRYRLAECPEADAAHDDGVCRDRVEDLELYEPSAPWWLPKRAFLEHALARLSVGEHVYTVTAGGRLLHYAWLADLRETTFVQEVDQTFRYAIPGAVLYDAHTLPEARGRGLHTHSLVTRLHDARSLGAARWAYVGCLAGNKASRGVIEKSGFAYYTSLLRAQRLGVTTRWQSTRPS